MLDTPESRPSACPGPDSDQAGKGSSCAGCPNKLLCASGEAKKSIAEREPELVNTIKNKLSNIHRRILVISGKGGVGKSSVSVCIARGLSRWAFNKNQSTENYLNVGLLDLDICGPSVPCMLDAMDQNIHQSNLGWEPVYVSQNLSAISSGFLMNSPDNALVIRGPRKDMLISQFLQNTNWTSCDSKLDFLIIDTPPGTSDEILSLVGFLKAAESLDYCIIVSTPQDISINDVRKSIDFCKKTNLKVLGIVENMCEFVCPKCDKTSEIFPRTSGGAKAMSDDFDIPLIASLPIDPRLTRYLDEGLDPFDFDNEEIDSTYKIPPTAPIIQAYNQLIQTILAS